MKNNVTINGQKVSVGDAIIWASKKFGNDSVSMEHSFPGQLWKFSFKEPKHATLFALKWSQ